MSAAAAAIGAIQSDVPAPPHPPRPRGALRQALDAMKAGQSRVLAVPEGKTPRAFTMRVSQVAADAWGKSNSRVKREDLHGQGGQGVRVWRLR